MTNQPDRELEWLREEAIKEGWYLVCPDYGSNLSSSHVLTPNR